MKTTAQDRKQLRADERTFAYSLAMELLDDIDEATDRVAILESLLMRAAQILTRSRAPGAGALLCDIRETVGEPL